MRQTEAEPRSSHQPDAEREQPLIICVFGMAKSASRRIATMVAGLPPDPFPRTWRNPSWKRSKSYELFPELLDEAPEGGVFHVQSLPTDQNLTTVRQIGARVLVTVRHPADQLTAIACFQRRRAIESGRDAIPAADAMIGAAIEAGELKRWLEWEAAWLEAAPMVGGCVLRYEDLLSDPKGSIAAVGRHILAHPPEERRLEEAIQRLQLREAKREQTLNTDYYPQGWTGEVGVWRNYFIDADRRAYESTVADFLATDSRAACLLEYYPDALTAVRY